MNLAEVIQELIEKYRDVLLSGIPLVAGSVDKHAIFQAVIVETVQAMRDACKGMEEDFRAMVANGSTNILGEEYTQGYNSAIQDFKKLMDEFIYSCKEKEEEEEAKRKC